MNIDYCPDHPDDTHRPPAGSTVTGPCLGCGDHLSIVVRDADEATAADLAHDGCRRFR